MPHAYGRSDIGDGQVVVLFPVVLTSLRALIENLPENFGGFKSGSMIGGVDRCTGEALHQQPNHGPVAPHYGTNSFCPHDHISSTTR